VHIIRPADACTLNFRAWTTGMFPLHALLFRLEVIMVYPSLIACYIALQKHIPVQLHELQSFTGCLTSHFLDRHLGDPSCTDFCCQQMFARDHPIGTSAYAHSQSAISCTLTPRFCSTVFLNSMTVFLENSFRWTSRLGHIVKASSASVKHSCPVLNHSIWWRMFIVNNSHSVVYLLRLNM